MSRFLGEYSVSLPADALMHRITQYLSSEGYQYTNYQNEYVYKKGKGIAAGPTFVKLTLNNNILRVEAWIKFAVLPGVYAGEMNLEGVSGIAVKKPLKARVSYIESLILSIPGNQLININPNFDPAAMPQYNQPPVNPQPQYTQQPQHTQQPQYNPPPQYTPPTHQAPEQKYIKCIRCGAVIPADSSFCSTCGYAVKK